MRRNFKPQVGDLVRFRDWDDMVAEFGVSVDWVECECSLPEYMYEEVKNIEFRITSVNGNVVEGHGTRFKVSFDMIELVNEVEYDTEEIDTFLDTMKIRE